MTQRLQAWKCLVVMTSVATIGGCSCVPDPPQTITLATTTSTRDSGLLDVLVPAFQQQTGIEVKVVAVGTGQALEMGRRGDADVLLTHAPPAEQEFMAAGYGSERRPVMVNDFVLVGPPADPAGIQDATSAAAALQRIADGESVFVSRGDESGTHMKENRLWAPLSIQLTGNWYIEAGSGMAQTLRLASEKQAYTLTDRGTFLAQQDGLELKMLFQGDALLQNPYAVILINPARHPHVNQAGAAQFADFLTSPQTQETIGTFGVEKHGQPLFFPDAARPQLE